MVIYTYHIAGNFRWCKFSRKSVQTQIFAVFIFADVGPSGHTPTSWWPRPICETALNDEAKKQACATTAWSSFCVEAFEITKVSRQPPRAGNRRVGFSWSRPFNNFGTSHGFVGILDSSRLILLYSNHLEGRQTVQNHLVHIGARNDVINFHLSAFFFAVFIFARKQACPRKSRKFAPSENFPLYGSMYIDLYYIFLDDD